MNKHIEALLVEREGYVRRNKPDRVKQIDEQLRELGFDKKLAPVEAAAIEPETEQAVKPRAKKRG